MARNYDRLIRFYDSWFDDLIDSDKGFTPEEQLMVIMAIRECQRSSSTHPLDELPGQIKRGLSMATLREQIARIIERVERVREKGRIGAEMRSKSKSEAEQQVIENNSRKELAKKSKEDEEREFFSMVKKKFGLSSYDLYAIKDNRDEILKKIYHEDEMKNVVDFKHWKMYRGLN